MTVPFILDTDTAQDDCVALIASLLDPDGLRIVSAGTPVIFSAHGGAPSVQGQWRSELHLSKLSRCRMSNQSRYLPS